MIECEVPRAAPARVARGTAGLPLRLILLCSLVCPYTSPAFAQLPVDNTSVRVLTSAREHLAHQASAGKMLEPLYEVTLANTTRAIPQCRQNVTIDAVDTRQPNRMRFSAVCADAPPWRIEFVVRATVSAKVLVAALPLMANKALAETDVALERRDVSGIADSLNDAQAVLGMSSKRALRAGDILRQSQLAALPVIKRGEAVRIIARREQIEVSMGGEALEAGTQNAVLKVRNSASGNVIRARVTAPGTVEPVDQPAIQSPD